MHLPNSVHNTAGWQRRPPGKESTVKNIDRLRQMNTDQLAHFLTDSNADTPLDFCQGCEHYLGEEYDCPECEYNDDEKAWRAWLERKVRHGC